MAKYIGLIILMIAVSAGVCIATNKCNVGNLKLNIPITVKPVSIPSLKSKTEENVLSPAFETRKPVSIDSIRIQREYDNYTEVRLSSNLSENEVINITGWMIKSKSGSFIIPKAQEVYSFGGGEGNVNLKPGDRVYIYSGVGPKGNFRMNKCMGHIADFSNFIPSIPKNCPSIKRSEIVDMSGLCQDYLLSLSTCENPVGNPPVPFDDNSCHQFLSKLNYVGCVEKYGNDLDFSVNEWWLWIDKINIFDSLHDKVQLLDKKANIVDEYIY